jgi:hypothetical protein
LVPILITKRLMVLVLLFWCGIKILKERNLAYGKDVASYF